MNDVLIFAAVRKIVRRHSGNPLEGLVQLDVDELNAALHEAREPPPQPQGPGIAATAVSAAGGALRASEAAINLIHSFETLKLTAYKDPGSRNGLPITNGWGTTVDEGGGPIPLGAVWTREKADRLFARDLHKFEEAVRRAIGDAPTTQNQFDALVSFHYNTGAIATATLTKKHRAGDYAGALLEFARWNKNDGKVMPGLSRRRAAEAALYGKRA